MKLMFTIFFVAFTYTQLSFACEVKFRDAKILDATKQYVIPVTVKANSICVIYDRRNESVEQRNIWNNLEKIMLKKNDSFGKLKRIYKTSGEQVIQDQYVYTSGNKTGSEDIAFIATISPRDSKYDQVVFRVQIEKN